MPDAPRRRRPPRIVRLLALTAVALGVLGAVVVIPAAHRAAADSTDFASVYPMSFVDQDPGVAELTLAVSLPMTPADVSYRLDSGQTTTLHALSSPAMTKIPVSELAGCGPHSVIVTVKDTYSSDPPKSQTLTQTISGVTRLCPSMQVAPSKVMGTDPVTITFPNWNSDGRFDSFGSYPEAAVTEQKRLFVNGVEVGEFGYQVVPTAQTPTLKDGDNEITVVQDTPSGTVQATGYLNSWNSTWAVSPQGVVAVPAAPIKLTVTDSADHCGGTTARVYLDDETTVRATVSQPGDGRDTLPPASFSDDGYFETAGSGQHSILVTISEGQACSVIRLRFAGLDVAPGDPGDPGDGGGFGDNPPDPPPAPTTVRIPFTVLDPSASVEYSELDQSALPYTQTVNLPGFDLDDDIYNNRDLQPRTVFVDDQEIGTTTAAQWETALNPPCGDSVLKATQPTSFGVATAHTPLRVLCPQVQLSPAVIAEAAQPATLQLGGHGFHRSDAPNALTRPYVITLDGTQVGAGAMDDAGAFTSSFPAARLPCGAHQVTVTELPAQLGGGGLLGRLRAAPAAPADPDGPLTVTTPLTVNCPADPGNPGRPHPSAPTLAVNPHGVIAGLRTFVTGTGFTPGHEVTLTWTLPSGKEAACPGTTVTARPDGTISAPCLIRPHDRLGRRELTADDGSRSAHTDALIISSTMQPSRGRDRLVIRR